MSDSIFVDTNVLIYARDAAVPSKQKKAAEWIEHLWNTNRGRLSFQVLTEYYVNVTQKLKPGMNKKEAREDISSFLSWKPAPLDEQILIQAWEIQDRHKISFWDAQILAAAKSEKCRFLLSEDFSAGKEYSGILILNPFKTSIAEL